MIHKTWAVMDVDKSEVFIQVGDVKYKIIVTVDKLGSVQLRLANEDCEFDLTHADTVLIVPIEKQEHPLMSEPVIWQGKELPPKNPGHVWAIRMWPNGRKELRQVLLEQMHNSSEATKRLQNGHCANVWLDDAVLVVMLLPVEHPQRRDYERQPNLEKWDLS